MFLTELSPPLWDDLVMPGDDMNEHQNGGALAVISASLGKVEAQLLKVAEEQASQREYLTRFDERQRGWSTKHEVSELSLTLNGRVSGVEAKADRALIRSDENSAALGVIGTGMEALRNEIINLRSELTTRQAEVRGAWSVLRPTFAWACGVLAVIVSAYLVGRYATAR